MKKKSELEWQGNGAGLSWHGTLMAGSRPVGRAFRQRNGRRWIWELLVIPNAQTSTRLKGSGYAMTRRAATAACEAAHAKR
jgi:hypothetical protein